MKERLGADRGCASSEQWKDAQRIESGESGGSAEEHEGRILGQARVGFENDSHALLGGDRFDDSGRYEKRSSSLLIFDRFVERSPDLSWGSQVQIRLGWGGAGVSRILLLRGRTTEPGRLIHSEG
jgi:hypothetical protein